MNNIINYNNKLINIVWIDRGIKNAIIFNILKYYNKIKNKNIIIENKDYRLFSKIMFPELIFKKFDLNNINNNNFYFNIRKKLIKKDIFIDNIYNYIDKKIPTKKIYLVPWFDINDPLISFRYSKKKYLNSNKVLNKIILFGNYNRKLNNKLWDSTIEYNIFYRYILYKYKEFNIVLDIKLFYNKFYSLLKQYYKKPKYPIIITKPIRNTIILDNNNDNTFLVDNSSSKHKNPNPNPDMSDSSDMCEILSDKISLLEQISLLNNNFN